MGMKITQQSIARVCNYLGSANEVVETACREVYAEAGAYIVEKIRSGEMSDWMDQTGNLRSSIGYVVCVKGRVVKMSDFGVVKDGADGARKGRALAERLARELSARDMALIIVAGEEYAVYVEAVEGKVVLSSAYLHLERSMPEMLKEKIRKVLNDYEDRH